MDHHIYAAGHGASPRCVLCGGVVGVSTLFAVTEQRSTACSNHQLELAAAQSNPILYFRLCFRLASSTCSFRAAWPWPWPTHPSIGQIRSIAGGRHRAQRASQVLATVLLRSPCISALAGRALSSSAKLRLPLSLQLLHHLKLVDQERAYAWQLEPRSGPPGRSIISNPSGEIDRSTTLTCTVLASYSEFPKIYCTCAFSTRSQHS